jgi:3-oxoacyl-[acyl-carrier-protein] synthase II
MRRVVVTGAGLVTPAGLGRKAFDAYLRTGGSQLRVLNEYGELASPIRVAGTVPEFNLEQFVPQRLAKRCDRFSHLALVAAGLALDDARLSEDSKRRERCGLMIGNNLGGWAFGQQGLYDLYRTGADSLSAYQAIAWFPGAPQGQISIHHRLKGYSKTVVADRASGLAAIAAAMRVIRLGHTDLMLAGGTEAPIAPYALICYLSAGQMSASGDPATAFRPFDGAGSGLVLSEGAALLVLEEREHALRRGATVLGELTGYGVASSGCGDPLEPGNADAFGAAMRRALSTAGWTADTLDYVCADGCAIPEADRAEVAAIQQTLGSARQRVPVSSPKAGLGHMLGGAGAADVYATLAAMEAGRIAPTIGQESPDPEWQLDFVMSSPRDARVRRALVNAGGRGGIAACLAVAAA